MEERIEALEKEIRSLKRQDALLIGQVERHCHMIQLHEGRVSDLENRNFEEDWDAGKA